MELIGHSSPLWCELSRRDESRMIPRFLVHVMRWKERHSLLSVVCGPQTSEPLQVFANSVDSSYHPTFNESEFIHDDVWYRLNTSKKIQKEEQRRSVQLSSVAQSCPTLCNPMNRSTPGLPVHHQLLEFTQTHVHRVGDAIQLSHPLSSPSPPAPNPSQHQSLFQWVNPSHEVAKLLEFQL